MTLADLLRQRRLRRHRPSVEEIANLLAKAQQDLRDATVPDVSLDGRFMAAYNPALSLAAATDIARCLAAPSAPLRG